MSSINNLTNQSTIATTSSTASITNIMNYFDIFGRCLLLISHITYFIVVILFRDFHRLSFFNMHHTNFIGLLCGILYCSWINQSVPTFADQNLNNFLCSISEIFWPVFRYTRANSILVLAIYRYLAVFHTQIFSKIVHSLKYYIISACLAWLISIIIFVISKYSVGAVASTVMCVDGTTTSLTKSIIYYLITTIPGYITPSVLVVIAYIRIHSKLHKLTRNLNSSESSLDRKSSKETKLALQLILLNVFNIFSIISLMLVTVNRWVPVLEKNFFYLRQLWRVTNNLSQSVIPFIPIMFHPVKLSFDNMIIFRGRVASKSPISSRSHSKTFGSKSFI